MKRRAKMMAETVSFAAIGGMVLTLLVSIAIPVAALIIVKKRTKGNMLSVLIGAGTFVVFALILEQILHSIMLSAFGESLTGNVWAYALYGGLAAGLFEETGRALSMKFLMKKSLSKENSVMFGIGHGGAESIILIGLTYISNIVIAVMINVGMLDTILSTVDESLRAQAMEQLSALWTTPFHQFYLAGIERVAAFVLQICMSYIVYRAVKQRKPGFYLLALTIHFIIDAGLILLMKVVSVYIVEAVLIAAVACLSVVVYKWYKKE